MVDFYEILARVKKYAYVEEMYDAHGPPPAPTALPTPIVEWPPTLGFQEKRTEGRVEKLILSQYHKSPPWIECY